MSFWLLEIFLDLIPVGLPFWLEIKVDGWAFLFTLALSTVAGILVGALPARRLLKVDLHTVLKETGKSSIGSLRRRRSSGMLVALEVGMTEALLVAAALAGLSFLELQKADLGFEPGDVLVAQIALPETEYAHPDEQRRYFQRLLEALHEVPGVRSAAVTSRLPLRRSDLLAPFTIDRRPAVRKTDGPVTSLRLISPKYFESLGIPLRRGRAFGEHDDQRSEPVVIVNATFARLFFPQEDPMGRRIRLTLPEQDTPWLNVLGIVEDVADYGPDSLPRPAVYVPLQQFPSRFMDIALRFSHAPESLANVVRQEVLELDSNLPVFDVTTMQQIVEESYWQNRFFAIIFAFFAATALVLASVGLYGVVSYSVRRRTPEIAIRMSFGAGSAQIFRLAAGEGMRSVAAGLALGLLAALGSSQTLSSLLFGVSPADPATFAGVILILGTVAFVSCIVPALRAIRIDPITNLRAD
jgi:putative ABC transport system permease protein